MRKLEHIEQLDDAGCGIACVAMIAGLRYFELRQLLWDKKDAILYLNNGPVGQGMINILNDEIQDILKKLFDIDSQWIQFTSMENLKRHCILIINDIKQHWGNHAVVFDVNRNKILNPSKNIITNNLRIKRSQMRYNVSHCLKIY